MENYEKKKTSGLAVAGFITSLVSVFLGGILWLISLPLSIAGTVSASRGRSGKGFGIAGIIISAFCVLELFLVIVIFGIGNYVRTNEKIHEDRPTIEKTFGSYEISSSWIEAKKRSSKDFLYCYRTRKDQERPNNIEVRCDSYDYREDEVLEFKESLQAQMYAQAPKGAVVTGSAFPTANGYDAFVYTFTDEENGTTCSQYYIMGDKRFVMVSAMIWDKEEDETDETIKCAEKIVRSFEWK